MKHSFIFLSDLGVLKGCGERPSLDDYAPWYTLLMASLWMSVNSKQHFVL
jgi:hypothetical protein